MSATGHDRTTSPAHAATTPSPLAGASPRHARVAFVGAGPGDPGLLTIRGSQLLAAADALVLDAGVPRDVVAAHQRHDVTIVEAGFGDEGVALTRASRAKLLVRTAKATTVTQLTTSIEATAAGTSRGLVVRVMAGDPGTFNGLATELAACHKAGLEVETQTLWLSIAEDADPRAVISNITDAVSSTSGSTDSPTPGVSGTAGGPRL